MEHVIRKTLVWAVVTVMLAAATVAGMQDGGFLDFGDFTAFGGALFRSYTYDNASSYRPANVPAPSAERIDRIDIHWESGSVTVRAYDGDRITFRETASRTLTENQMLHYRVQDGVLSIRPSASVRSLFGSFSVPSKALEVLVPKNAVLASVGVECVSADILIEDVNVSLGDISTENVSGATTVRGALARLLDAEAVSGRLNAEGAFDKVTLEGVSGAMAIKALSMPTALSAETVSGQITVTVPENGGFTANFDTVSGSLRCSFAEIRNHRSILYGDGKARFTFESISGSVMVDKFSPPAPTESAQPEGGGDPVPSSGRKF